MNIEKKNTRALIYSDINSTLGSSLFFLAMMWTVHENSQTALATSTVSMIIYISISIFSYFSGVIVDKNNPKNILIFSQITSITILLSLLLTNIFWGYSYEFILFYIFLLFASYSFSNPSEAKLIPKIINENNITKLFSYRSTSTQLSEIFATAIGGSLVLLIGFNGSIMVNILFFFLSLIFTTKIRYLKPLKYHKKNENSFNFYNNTKNIINLLKENILLKYFFTLSLLLNVSAILGPLWVVLVADKLSGSANDYSLIQALGIMGGIFASLSITKLNNMILKKYNKILIFSLFFYGVFLSVIFFLPYIRILYIIFPIISFFKVISSIIISSKLIEHTPDHLRGIVSGYSQSIGTAIIPILTIISGYTSDIYGVEYIFLFLGSWIIVFSIVFLLKFKKI